TLQRLRAHPTDPTRGHLSPGKAILRSARTRALVLGAPSSTFASGSAHLRVRSASTDAQLDHASRTSLAKCRRRRDPREATRPHAAWPRGLATGFATRRGLATRLGYAARRRGLVTRFVWPRGLAT